jgi:hypothetical protein
MEDSSHSRSMGITFLVLKSMAAQACNAGWINRSLKVQIILQTILFMEA